MNIYFWHWIRTTFLSVLAIVILGGALTHSALAQTAEPETSEQSEAQTPPDEAEPEPVKPVEKLPPKQIDLEIKSELEQIFLQDVGLDAIAVTVNAGVVNLAGDVPNEEQAVEAVRLASGMDGVVKVQDNMVRTLALTDNVAPMLVTTKNAIAGFIRALPLIGFALLVLWFFTFIGNRLIRLKKLWSKMAPNPFLADLLGHAVRIVAILTGLVLGLKILGADRFITTVLGGAGVAGIAIGFAVRDTIENYIASIMLSLRQPFRGGDHVLIDSHEGKVVRLTSRATILMTLDGNHLRIPNAQVFKAVILNYTTNPERRFTFELGVDAADDPIAAMNIATEAISELDFVLDDPAPGAGIKHVGDSNIVLKFTGWVDQTDTSLGKARGFAIRAATTVLEDQGFTLPEPIYRVKFDKTAAGIFDSAQTSNQAGKKPPKTSPEPPPERASPVDDHIPTQDDVAPDQDLEDKVTEEREKHGEKDLLDESQPTE